VAGGHTDRRIEQSDQSDENDGFRVVASSLVHFGSHGDHRLEEELRSRLGCVTNGVTPIDFPDFEQFRDRFSGSGPLLANSVVRPLRG
jgi:hypothetical protein